MTAAYISDGLTVSWNSFKQIIANYWFKKKSQLTENLGKWVHGNMYDYRQ